MELHEYMESRGITRESIAAEQEKTRERIEAYKLAQGSDAGLGSPVNGCFSKAHIGARAR